MAKFDFDVAVAFAPQSAEGVYDPTLDAISATLDGDPGGTDDGLLLGDSASGIGGSGLTLVMGREGREKAVLGSSFTRPISDYLRTSVRSFQFAFPWCGNRGTISGTPADAEYEPLVGVQGLLAGLGMVGADWGSGDGRSWKFGAAEPLSALVYVNGFRGEFLDCRLNSLSINYTPGSIAIATADVAVGSVKDPAAKGFSPASLPTLTYGPQATVSAPVIELVGNTWQDTKGFQSLTLTITPEIREDLDSNLTDGVSKAPAGRETKIEATMFGDDADKVHALDQAYATVGGDLDALSFQVGTDAGAAAIAEAIQLVAPQPALDQGAPQKLGTRGGDTVSLILGHDTANEELELIFR